jgi:hypothetical protein
VDTRSSTGAILHSHRRQRFTHWTDIKLSYPCLNSLRSTGAPHIDLCFYWSLVLPLVTSVPVMSETMALPARVIYLVASPALSLARP